MVQEVVEKQERQSLEAFFGGYDEKFRAAFSHVPKFIFRKIIDSSRTGLMGAAEVHDDFLPLLQLAKARTAVGAERLARDRTNDTLVDEAWCLGFSESMGGFAVLSIDSKKGVRPREIRRLEEWNQDDWQIIGGLRRDKMEQVFDASIALAKANMELSQEAAQGNPESDTTRWGLLWNEQRRSLF